MSAFRRAGVGPAAALTAALAVLAGPAGPTARAQEGEAPPPAPAAPESAGDAAVTAAKYRRSKLTNDASEGTADKRRLLLTTGEDKAVDLDFEANAGANGISIGNPAIVATQLVRINERRQIVFKPLKKGDTTVTVRDADGTIRLIFTVRVSDSNLLRQAAEVRELLRDIEGVSIRIVGKKIVVDGEVLVPADYARVLAVIGDAAYQPDVINLTTLSPLAMQMLAKRIQEDINNFAPNVKTRVVNGMIFLEGTVDNGDQASRAKEVAALYLPEVRPGNPLLARDGTALAVQGRSLVQNFIVINPPPPRKQEKLVRVTVHFVELAKDYGKVFGFKWAPGFTADPTITVGTTADGGAGAGGASFTATLSSLFPKLQSAQSAGYARVLKSGTVIVRSGQPAKLADQTSYPYQTGGAQGVPANVGNVQVGLVANVTPLILGQSEDIQLDLNLTQRNLVRVPASGIPITADHEVNTKIYVKSAESAAVAGVESSNITNNFNKDDPNPGNFQQGAGGVPTSPLFTLLRSKNYQKNKGQFVIFVTPQIIENASDGTDDLKRNFRVKVK